MNQIANNYNTTHKLSSAQFRGSIALLLIQTFSTMSFSILYSTLVLYITKGLHFSDTAATAITASFIAFNYTLHLFGGFVGGRLLSYRVLFCIGMLLQAVACVLLSIPKVSAMYWGVAAFVVGSGFNVTCINCLVTQLFDPKDKRREGAFLWNYSGMNIGFFVGFAISGYLELQNNYPILFLSGAATNFVALILAFFSWKLLGDKNTSFVNLPPAKRPIAQLIGLGIIILLIPALRWLIQQADFSNSLIMCIGILMAFVIAYLAIKQDSADARRKIWAFIILALSATLFWSLYQLAPLGLTLFTANNVNLHYLGFTLAPQWAQNINSVVIIFGGPLCAWWFNRLRTRGKKLTIPLQFSLALWFIGLGFIILPIGIHFADSHGYSSFNWIIGSYVLQSIGELLISPIGYAMIGFLAPIQLQGIFMGTWMMVSGVGVTLSNYFSKLAIAGFTTTDPLITNASYSHTFQLLGWMALGCALLLTLLIPMLQRLTKEV